MNLLIVDDEERLRKLYELELSKEGYATFGLPSGHEALELINRNHNVDMVVLDLKLKDMDGFELLRGVRRELPDIPVVINSAYSIYKSDFNSWLADAYLVKSSDLTELKETIKELLHSKRHLN